MKKITLWLFALFTCWQISAQTTVTIGTGTSSATGGTNGNPIYRSSASSTFNFSQSIQLLTAADLAAAGVTSGATITKIAFYKNDAFTMSAGRTATMNIYLKNSSATALTTASNFATWTTGSTNCYSNAVIGPANFPAAAGWVEYTLSTPFNYSGGAIETAIDWAINTGAGNATTGAFSWLYTTSTAIQAVGTSSGTAITGNLATSQLRQYNTQITFTNTPCSGTPAPGNTIAPSSICFGSSATLSLQNSTIGSGVTYQWYLNALAIGGATSSTYTIASVTSSDTYYCEVTCSGNTTASNSLSVGPNIISAPLLEPFATFLPNCWTNMFGGDVTTGPTASTGSGWVADGFANSGTTGAIRNEIWTTGANDWVISPVINIPAVGYELKFDAAATQWNVIGSPTTPWESDDFIEVLVSTTGLTNWTPIFTYNDTNQPSNTGTPNILDLNAYAGQNIRIAFRAVEGATNGAADIDFSLDNFQVRLTPTCPDQTGLTLGTVTATTADFSWDDLNLGGALGYEYAITTSATPPASGTSTTATIYSATGLSPQTVYYMHVRSSCAAATFGNWATITFTTACAPIATLPWLENFDALTPGTNVFPACWAYSNTTNTWSISTTPVAYSGANSLRRTWSTDGWAFTPIATLTAGISYRFSYYVRTNDAVVGYDITVGVGSLQTSAAMTNTLSTVAGYQGPAWVRVNHEFTPTVTGEYSFGVHVVAPLAPNGINFDDFKIELSPTCPDQTGLTIGTVTSSTADTSWDDLNLTGAVGYEYAITTSATPPASGTSTTATIYAATGLSPLTVYYLHVRAECSGSTYGAWATTTFTTACAPFSVPVLEPFNTFLPNTCWTEADNGDITAGPLTFGSGSWLVDGFGNVGTTGAARVTLDAAADNDWIISPEFTIPATGYELKFDAAATQGGTVNTPTAPWESDDFVEILVSTTSTTNWAVLYTYNDTNSPSNLGSANILDLDAYSGQNIRFAFRAVEGATNGAASIDFSIDNFQIRLTPPCPDQTGLTLGTVTATTADFSWDDLNLSGALGYEYAITTSATPPASGTSTTATIYSATGLSPQTVYYMHVRSSCAAATFGNWATVTFTTACAPLATLPWLENFDALTPGTNVFPSCWNYSNTANTWSISTTPVAYSGANSLRRTWSTNGWAFTPMFSLTAGTSYTFSYFVRTNDAVVGYDITVGVGNSQNSAAMTTTLSSVVGYQGPAWTLVTLLYTPTVSGDYSFGVQVVAPLAPNGINFDNFELKLTPACPAPIVSTSNITNLSADLSWAAVPSATLGYEYVLDNVATDPAGSGTSTTALTYSATGLTQLTTYYFHIRSVCSVGTYSTWSTVSFTTLATPPVNDNCSAATALTIGATFASNITDGNTTGATSGLEGTPTTCLGYSGGDIWYSALVPASGTLSIETGNSTLGATGLDTVFTIYTGTCGALTQIDCDDDGATTGAYSFKALTGLTPGSTLLIRVYEYSNDNAGSFGISAYDASLSAASFDKSNFVAYPNPVKDVLNLSYKTAISNVRVINLLGQEVLNTKANSNDVKVNMSALNSGAYIVNITVDDTVHTIKVIKE
jgi:hypothetical protein